MYSLKFDRRFVTAFVLCWSSDRGALNSGGGSWTGLGRGVALAKRGFSAFSDGVFECFLELRKRSGVFFELQAGKGKWRYRAQKKVRKERNKKVRYLI